MAIVKNILLLIILAIINFPAFAETKELNIVDGGNNIGYPPYYYYKNKMDKHPQGILPDIITEIEKKTGIRINWTSLPWNRALSYIKSGKADAMLPLIKTKKRLEFMSFSDTEISYEENSFFVPKNSLIKYSGNLQELSQYRIGAIDTYSYGRKFDTAKNRGMIQLENVFSEKQLIKMLINNRFEIGIGNKSVISWHLKKTNSLDKVKFLLPIISRDPLLIAFSKKTKELESLKRDFSDALRTMKENGRLQAIHEKYGVNIEY